MTRSVLGLFQWILETNLNIGKDSIKLSKFEDDEDAIPEIDVRIVSCVSCEDKVACVTDLHSHIQIVYRKERYNCLTCHNNLKQTSNAKILTKTYLFSWTEIVIKIV